METQKSFAITEMHFIKEIVMLRSSSHYLTYRYNKYLHIILDAYLHAIEVIIHTLTLYV